MTELSKRPLRRIDHVDAVTNDSVVPFYLDDVKLRIAVARVDDLLFAFDELCTHRQCPLSGGVLSGTTIACHCHGSRFDVTTGEVLHGPATDALNVYEVQEVDGDVLVRV